MFYLPRDSQLAKICISLAQHRGNLTQACRASGLPYQATYRMLYRREISLSEAQAMGDWLIQTDPLAK